MLAFCPGYTLQVHSCQSFSQWIPSWSRTVWQVSASLQIFWFCMLISLHFSWVCSFHFSSQEHLPWHLPYSAFTSISRASLRIYALEVQRLQVARLSQSLFLVWRLYRRSLLRHFFSASIHSVLIPISAPYPSVARESKHGIESQPVLFSDPGWTSYISKRSNLILQFFHFFMRELRAERESLECCRLPKQGAKHHILWRGILFMSSLKLLLIYGFVSCNVKTQFGTKTNVRVYVKFRHECSAARQHCITDAA
jgi:hypothetical protein